MTKRIAKIVTVGCLALVMTTGAFAKSAYFSTSVDPIGKPVYPLTVDTPEAVVDWFEDQGLDVGSYSTDLGGMPVEYRNEVRDLYDDDDYKDELDAIAQKALMGLLEEGSVEHVTTHYGPISWTMQYDNSDEEY